MNKFLIPRDNQEVKLTQDWTFILGEQGWSHSVDLDEKLFPGKASHEAEKEYVTLPIGTVLCFASSRYAFEWIVKIRQCDLQELKFIRGKNKAIFRTTVDKIEQMEFDFV